MTSSTDAQSSFRPQQVICLEQGERRLYASVIQFIELQQTYWLRPLCLVENSENYAPHYLFTPHFRCDCAEGNLSEGMGYGDFGILEGALR